MLTICGVCGKRIPEGASVCPNDGADSKSFERVMVSISAEKAVFRIHELPFEGTRDWARSHFKSLSAPDGNPAYKYVKRDGAMFAIEMVEAGYVVTSDIEPADDVNHWRVSGVPVGKPGILLERTGQTLELWSGRRHQIVMQLSVGLESFI